MAAETALREGLLGRGRENQRGDLEARGCRVVRDASVCLWADGKCGLHQENKVGTWGRRGSLSLERVGFGQGWAPPASVRRGNAGTTRCSGLQWATARLSQRPPFPGVTGGEVSAEGQPTVERGVEKELDAVNGMQWGRGGAL